MKRLIYLLPTLLLLMAGCLSDNASAPIPDPSGTFGGEFRLLRKTPNATAVDTLKANIKLVLTPGVGFKVLGDTVALHAGSKGAYAIGNSGIRFVDSTYKTGNYTKRHLNGDYLLFYNGNVLQMLRNSGDSLSLQYNLKRVN